jgi:hypothetical protein
MIRSRGEGDFGAKMRGEDGGRFQEELKRQLTVELRHGQFTDMLAGRCKAQHVGSPRNMVHRHVIPHDYEPKVTGELD